MIALMVDKIISCVNQLTFFHCKVFILQMTERPGFDRFLMRLDHWGINYEAFEISEDIF